MLNLKPLFLNPKGSIAPALALAACAALIGCQGEPHSEPPIHLNQNMDFQTNFKPQKENAFYADGRAMRPQVPGVIARGTLKENTELHFGKTGEQFIAKIPLPVTEAFVLRGQERYNIYCTPCHGGTADGNGIVVKKGMLKPPNFHDQRIVDMPEGQIYDAIINGVRGNMPSYAYAIPVEDRWAIVSYVRALQLSQRASIEQIPSDISTSKGWKR